MLDDEPWAIAHMEEEGAISIFWEGHHAGIGWVVLEGEYQLLDWLKWQVSDEILGDSAKWGDHWEELMVLRKELPEEPPEDEFVSWAQRWLASLEKVLKGSNLGCNHQICAFRDMADHKFLSTALRINLEGIESNEDLERELSGRYGNPSLFF